MAIQTVTSPIALDETLQATNSVLEDIRDAIGASSLIGDTDISEIADGTLTGAVAEFDTKLSGISDGATKTESSTINGNIKIDGTETQVYNDSEIKTELSTDTSEVEGNPISFNTLSAQNATECLIDLEPIQDLHGYDKPWVGGAGKNLLPMTVDGIKAASTSGTWSGNDYTRNGITFTIQTDSDNNVIGILVKGTASADAVLRISSTNLSSLPDGTYAANGCPSNGSLTSYRFRGLGALFGDIGQGAVFTKTSSTDSYAEIVISANYACPTNGLTFYPMIRLATVTDSTFAPYTNICPISGRTEIGILGCGKNLFDKSDIEQGAINDSTGENRSSTTTYRTIGYIKVKPNTTYSFSGLASNTYRVFFYSDFGYLGSQLFSEDTAYIFNANTTRIRVHAGVLDSLKDSFQIEESPSVTAYSPYTESNDLTISLGQTVYGGQLDVEGGKCTVEKVNIKGNELEFTKVSDGIFKSAIQDRKFGTNLFPIISSDYGTYTGANSTVANIASLVATYGNNVYVNGGSETFFIADSRFSDLIDFTTYIANVNICYELATPITIQLTPNEISLLKGVNNISTDGDKITLTYRTGEVATLGDLKKAVDDMSAKQHVYSTEEQVVGKWSDGKTLYERTFEYTLTTAISGSSSGELVDLVSLPNVNMKKMEGYTADGAYPLPFLSYSAVKGTQLCMLRYLSDYIKLYDVNTPWAVGNTFVITARYTKITD